MANTTNSIQKTRQPLMDSSCREHIFSSLYCAISHDMRTPLANIIGRSLTLQENWELLSAHEKIGSVAQIHENSERLMSMVDNLLAITRVREEDPDIHVKEELLEEVVGEALEKLQKHHPNRTVHVKIPESYIFLPMDAALIEQVLLNLLENALNCSAETEPVEIKIEDMGNTVSFVIKDYGDHIPEDILNSLLGSLACTSPRTMDTHKRSGLMLITCKAILEAHQGVLTARNHSNGMEFTFKLPKQKEEAI